MYIYDASDDCYDFAIFFFSTPAELVSQLDRLVSAELAQTLTHRLLNPGVLDEGLRSGLFLFSPHDSRKSTFLSTELVQELKKSGVVVAYVGLQGNTPANPLTLIQGAICCALNEYQEPSDTQLRTIERAIDTRSGMMEFEPIFRPDSTGGPTLAQALTEIVDQTKTDLVLIIDEVDRLIALENGNHLLQALKAARDAINSRPTTPGHFLFIGTSPHKGRVNEMMKNHNHPFYGATRVDY